MQVSINVASVEGGIKEIVLEKPVTVIGRGADCDLRIPVENCSRRHCEIRIEDDLVFVKDLQSSNGTYINNEKVSETQIEPGDTMLIGPVTIGFRIDGKPEHLSLRLPEVDLDLEATVEEYSGKGASATVPYEAYGILENRWSYKAGGKEKKQGNRKQQ